MTSPVRSIQVVCQGCGYVYTDWYRASINLSLDNFDDEYMEQATTATCPQCQHKMSFGVLIVDAKGRWTMHPATPPPKPVAGTKAKNRAAKARKKGKSNE